MPDAVARPADVDLATAIRRGLGLAPASPDAVDIGAPLSAAGHTAPLSIASGVSRSIPSGLVNLARVVGGWAGPAGLVVNQLVPAPNTLGAEGSNNRIVPLWRFLRTRHPRITPAHVAWMLKRQPDATPETLDRYAELLFQQGLPGPDIAISPRSVAEVLREGVDIDPRYGRTLPLAYREIERDRFLKKLGLPPQGRVRLTDLAEMEAPVNRRVRIANVEDSESAEPARPVLADGLLLLIFPVSRP